MAINVSKTSHFTDGAGTAISFSEIRAQFGGSATNVKASTYLRNTETSADFRSGDGKLSESSTESRIPDAKENENVTSEKSNWNVDSLRDTVSKYVLTQTGTNASANANVNLNNETWNSNLSKNVFKQFNVEGQIYGSNYGQTALSLSTEVSNLDINVKNGAAVYGASGLRGVPDGIPGISERSPTKGGDALYINNTRSIDDGNGININISGNGKIWSGGGGGGKGSDGTAGAAFNCTTTEDYTHPDGCGSNTQNGYVVNGQRGRCRGRGTRRGQAGYHCGNGQTYTCTKSTTNTISGGPAGKAGYGGFGLGWQNRNISYNSTTHQGGGQNSGGTNNCSSGGSSSGNAGTKGDAGGRWGSSSSQSAGYAIRHKNCTIEGKTTTTVKGPVNTI